LQPAARLERGISITSLSNGNLGGDSKTIVKCFCRGFAPFAGGKTGVRVRLLHSKIGKEWADACVVTAPRARGRKPQKGPARDWRATIDWEPPFRRPRALKSLKDLERLNKKELTLSRIRDSKETEGFRDKQDRENAKGVAITNEERGKREGSCF